MTTRASRLLGAAVVDPQGRRLGRISDLLLDDPGPASVCYAVLELQPSTNQGARTVAVPWSVLEPGEHERERILAVSKRALHSLRGLDSH